MKLVIVICLLAVSGACVFERNGQKEIDAKATEILGPNITAQPSTSPLKLESKLVDVTRSDFVGCWTSGNGMIMQITDGKIFLSTNSFKPVSWVEYEIGDGRLVLQLTDRPQFFFFQEIVSLELRNDPEFGLSLTMKDYLSIEEYKKQAESGISGWVQDDCKKWFDKRSGGGSRDQVFSIVGSAQPYLFCSTAGSETINIDRPFPSINSSFGVPFSLSA